MPATTKKTLIAVVLASLFGQAWVSAQVTHYPSRGTQTQARQPRNSSAIRPTTMRYPTNRLSKPQPSTPRSQSNWPNQSWTNPFNARRSNVPPGQRNQMSSNNRTNRSVPGNQLRNNARSNPQPGSLQYPQRIAQTQYSEEDIQQLKAQHYRAVRQANYQDAPSTTLPRSDMKQRHAFTRITNFDTKHISSEPKQHPRLNPTGATAAFGTTGWRWHSSDI